MKCLKIDPKQVMVCSQEALKRLQEDEVRNRVMVGSSKDAKKVSFNFSKVRDIKIIYSAHDYL